PSTNWPKRRTANICWWRRPRSARGRSETKGSRSSKTRSRTNSSASPWKKSITISSKSSKGNKNPHTAMQTGITSPDVFLVYGGDFARGRRHGLWRGKGLGHMRGKTILLGVTGGIAAYKAAALASKLTQAGADVRVIMTGAAARFVSPLTFQTLTRNPVATDV